MQLSPLFTVIVMFAAGSAVVASSRPASGRAASPERTPERTHLDGLHRDIVLAEVSPFIDMETMHVIEKAHINKDKATAAEAWLARTIPPSTLQMSRDRVRVGVLEYLQVDRMGPDVARIQELYDAAMAVGLDCTLRSKCIVLTNNEVTPKHAKGLAALFRHFLYSCEPRSEYHRKAYIPPLYKLIVPPPKAMVQIVSETRRVMDFVFDATVVGNPSAPNPGVELVPGTTEYRPAPLKWLLRFEPMLRSTDTRPDALELNTNADLSRRGIHVWGALFVVLSKWPAVMPYVKLGPRADKPAIKAEFDEWYLLEKAPTKDQVREWLQVQMQ